VVSVEFTEITSSAFTPGHQDAAANGTTAVTILSAPASSTYRVVRHINVYNKDTVSATVTIQFNNNSTLRELVVVALASGQTLTWSPEGGWSVFTAVSTAASDTVAGVIEIATQAEMETATDTARAVTPGRLVYHPGACKCWGKANGAGTSLLANYNVNSITDTGTGQLTVTIETDFSSADYSAVCSLERSVTALTATGVEDNNIRNASQAAGSIQFESYDHTATTMAAQDPANYHFAMWGDRA
jgi:hypothetical protein